MDPQLLQGIAQGLKQVMDLIQQAQQQSGGDMDDPAGDAAGDDGMPPETGQPEGQGMPAAGMPPEGGVDGAAEGAGDDMGGGAADGMGDDSLHDRVSALEDHTGLAKSAGIGDMKLRLDALEEEIFGTPFDGAMTLRVQQLEKALGVNKPTPKEDLTATAPDEIPLDSLIKSAVRAALVEEGVIGGSSGSERLPSPASMRKTAHQQGAPVQGRRAQQPLIQADEDLQKAAQAWGMDGDLDAPATLGDVLLMQYHAGQEGGALPFDDDDD
jgi:hypothetical protein